MTQQSFSDRPLDQSAEECVRMYNAVQKQATSRVTAYSLLAVLGKRWTPAIKPDWVEFGPMGRCFQNSIELAAEHDLIYVEGYASAIIPMHHAWCVDKAGNVIDPTWPTLGTDYWGVPFDTDYVVQTGLRSGLYSIFWNYANREITSIPVRDFHSKDFAINCT